MRWMMRGLALKALLLNDVDEMNDYMNRIALHSFSSFDTAKSASDDDAPKSSRYTS